MTQRPSIGFCLIVLTYGLTVAFFAWGLGTPPLDRVWRLHHELKIGQIYDLSRDDRELLLSAMSRHSKLAAALLSSGEIGIISAHHDGWIDTPSVSIIRTPRSSAVTGILLDIQTPPQHIPYDLELQGLGWQQKRRVEERGLSRLELPPPSVQPELLTLTLVGKGLRADPSSLGVRVTFDPPEAAIGTGSEDDEEEEEEDE
jgi:hypothetical protein